MSTTHIISKSYDFKPTTANLEFGKASFNNAGYGNVSLSYNGNILNFQTHKMMSPFGFSLGPPAATRPDPQCQFNLLHKIPKDKATYDGLRMLEELIIAEAFQHRDEWKLFGNKTESAAATLEQVRAKFVPIIRLSKNPNYPDTFGASFIKKFNSNEITTVVHNENNEQIMPNEQTIPRRSMIISDVQTRQVWISPAGKFGVKFNIQKMKVYPPANKDVGGGGASEKLDMNASRTDGLAMPTSKFIMKDVDDDVEDDDDETKPATGSFCFADD